MNLILKNSYAKGILLTKDTFRQILLESDIFNIEQKIDDLVSKYRPTGYNVVNYEPWVEAYENDIIVRSPYTTEALSEKELLNKYHIKNNF